MSERFRLPPWMGGHECEIVWRSAALVAGFEIAKVRYEVDGFEVTSEVLFSWLTPVKPPLPEEPPVGKAVWIAERDIIFHRRHDGRFGWRGLVDGVDFTYSWEDVNGLGTPVLLVPDPLAGEPIQLPAKFAGLIVAVGDCGDFVCIREAANGLSLGHFTAAMAREFARAVWAAATQTEQGKP